MERFFRKHFWTVNLAAIALGAFFAAQAVARAVEAVVFLDDSAAQPRVATRRPLGPATHRRARNGDAILRRNIFCSDCPPLVEQADTQGPSSDDPVRTSLPLQLVATLVSTDPQWSFAALRDTDIRQTGLFGVASTVPPSAAEVVTIEERRVFLRLQGRLEYVDLEGGAPPAPAAAPAHPPAGEGPFDGSELDKGIRKSGENAFEIDRGLIDKVLGDPTFLARSARIVPSVKDGAPNGFKIYAIRPGSVYSRIGLSNGDTIHAINGNEITSPDKALEVYTKVRTASHINISLSRRGQPMTMDYSIR